MSQQSNPATLREALELAFYFAERHVPSKEGYCAKCGFCHCDRGHVLAMAKQGVLAALAASGTHSLPPSTLDGSMATAASDLDRLKAAYDDFEDYFVRNYPGPRTIIHKPKWHAPKIFQAAISALKLNDAVAMTDEAPQQLQEAAASPEGEGREATKAEAEVWLERNGYPYLEQMFNEFVDGPISRSRMNSLLAPLFVKYAALRQSAAPSGGLKAIIARLRDNANGRHSPGARAIFADIADELAALAQESKTGAVTETK